MLNLEALAPPPLFTVDDPWWFATLEAARDPSSGLTAVATPPYAPYLANANHVTAVGNPFAATDFRDRWYAAGCARR